MCLRFQQVSKGGTNVKASKGRGRLGGETPRAVIDYIKSISLNSLAQDPRPQFLPSPTLKKLNCSLCLNVAFPPVELSCEHIVCSDCCCRVIQATYSLSCPCCSDHILSSQTIHPPSSLLMSLLNDQLVNCVRRCGSVVKLQDYQKHLDSNCSDHRENMNSPSKITLKDVLGKSSKSPPTPAEAKAAHSLVKRLLNQGEGSSSSVIKVGCHGQVC